VELNPPGQYADDGNLRARQRLWACQVPFFDSASWVLDLAGLMPGMRVLDAGCGNGTYLRALRERRVTAVGCDLSPGMLRGAAHPALVTADVTAQFAGARDDLVAVQLDVGHELLVRWLTAHAAARLGRGGARVHRGRWR
jgi:SAM-dependent methyltransferase